MSFYDKFTDYLSTWYISDEDIKLHEDVAANQQALLNQRYNAGRVSAWDYWQTSRDIDAAGSMLGDYRKKNDNPLRVVPWWLWIVALGAVFWYLGGFTWLRGILARR